MSSTSRNPAWQKLPREIAASLTVCRMDAGIVTEASLKMLKEKKYGYVCISRSGLKNLSRPVYPFSTCNNGASKKF
jgi:hypothetical protein